MFKCPGLIFYTVCSVPWLNGNLALAEKCSGPLRFRLRQVLLYKQSWYTISDKVIASDLNDTTCHQKDWQTQRNTCVMVTLESTAVTQRVAMEPISESENPIHAL